MPSHNFYQRLCQIRLTAAILYDRGRAMKRGHEELAEDLRPLMKTLKQETAEAVDGDLPGVVTAIKMLESEARKHEQDAKFLMDKAADTLEHAERLKVALKEWNDEQGVSERFQGDFSVTLVNGKITVR